MGAITSITPKLYAAFGDDWQEGSPTFTDISSYVMRWQVTEGRATEYDRMRASTLRVWLKNTDRRFEPDFGAGAYSPDVKVMTPVALVLLADESGVNASKPVRFWGYAERWRQTYPGTDAAQVCVLEASSPLKIFSRQHIDDNIVSNLGGDQIDDILDEVSWPAGNDWRTVAGFGQTTMQAYDPVSESALSVINKIVDSEDGLLAVLVSVGITDIPQFANVTFYDRYTVAEGYGVAGTIGDDGTEISYTDIELAEDEQTVRNRAAVTRVGGSEQTDSHGVSIVAYGEQSITKTGLLMQTDNEALDMARHLVLKHRVPRLRAARVTIPIAVGMDRTNQAAPFNLAVPGITRFTIKRRPGGGAVTTVEGVYEGGTWGQSKPGAPVVGRLNFSPALDSQVWILGDATLGVLGETTYLGW